jgi:hypothetical protein
MNVLSTVDNRELNADEKPSSVFLSERRDAPA